MVTILTSRQFIQDAGNAKKVAAKGPVFITDRGRRAHVLLSIKDYRRLLDNRVSLLQALEQSGKEADFRFDPKHVEISLRKPRLG